jgi:hypothetical protein
LRDQVRTPRVDKHCLIRLRGRAARESLVTVPITGFVSA